MTLQKFHFYFKPVLQVLSNQEIIHRKDIMAKVATLLNVSKIDLELESEKGTSIFDSRIHWAQAYLAKALAITRPTRGYFQITERGLFLLEKYPEGFDTSALDQFPDYISAWGGKYIEPHQAKSGIKIKGYYKKP